MLRLRYDTPEEWKAAMSSDIDRFLSDHAHSERKVVLAALKLAKDNPGRTELVDAMIALAHEELGHFEQVHGHLKARGQALGFDQPDPYMGAVHRLARRRDVHEFLLDRLLLFGVVEARGCERFRMASEALPPGPLEEFYAELTRSEARHHALFIRLARGYFPGDVVARRLDALLDAEAEIAAGLPHRPALH